MRRIKFNVDCDFLHTLLELPLDVRIVHVTAVDESGCGFPTMQVHVESADFPEVTDGKVPLVNPIITARNKTWDFNPPPPPSIFNETDMTKLRQMTGERDAALPSVEIHELRKGDRFWERATGCLALMEATEDAQKGALGYSLKAKWIEGSPPLLAEDGLVHLYECFEPGGYGLQLYRAKS